VVGPIGVCELMEVAVGVTAQAVVGAYLGPQVETITGGQEDLRAEAPDSVHQVRVATRRVRTTLRVFRRLVRKEMTEPVRTELQWFAGVLGPVRDAEVLREHVLTALADLREEHRYGPVEQRLRTELDDEYQAARASCSPRWTPRGTTPCWRCWIGRCPGAAEPARARKRCCRR